ncbi:MAG: thiamine phosphate synthase [Muribaculaceae bacterium]|nr:thiamine phosphate synthase [Muribaculaceae bacterium]
MNRQFLKIGFTPPAINPDPAGEAAAISRLLESGIIDLLHLRHPEATRADMAKILTLLDRPILSRIVIHDHFRLIEEFPIGGLHLNSRNPEPPTTFDSGSESFRISRSCHSFAELRECALRGEYTYLTLSPIFDSISKTGYFSNFDPDDLTAQLKTLRSEIPSRPQIIALGGVTPDRIPLLKAFGFDGAAMLGSLAPHFFCPR